MNVRAAIQLVKLSHKHSSPMIYRTVAVVLLLVGLVVAGAALSGDWAMELPRAEVRRHESAAPRLDAVAGSSPEAPTLRAETPLSTERAPLHFQDPEFMRLAVSAELSDRYKAHSWLRECLNELAFAVMNVQHPRLCGLSDGNIDNLELRRKLVVDLVMNGAFGAVESLLEEGPTGRFKAFASDPIGHASIVAQAYEIGVSKGEPTALAAKAGDLESEGDKFKAVGDLESARDRYIKGLAYSVASSLGLAKQNGIQLDPNRDPNVEFALQQYQERLNGQDRKAAIEQGIRLAKIWKRS